MIKKSFTNAHITCPRINESFNGTYHAFRKEAKPEKAKKRVIHSESSQPMEFATYIGYKCTKCQSI